MHWMRNKNGFTLLELILVIVVLAVGLTGTLIAFTQGTQNSAYSQNMAVATVLAQDLMEEIRSKCWDETAVAAAPALPCSGPVAPSLPPLGPDGETRATYDDVDDFNALSIAPNTPPRNSQGAAMATYNIFTQKAEVCYVDPNAGVNGLNICLAGAATSNYKKIVVTISWGVQNDQVQLTTVATNH